MANAPPLAGGGGPGLPVPAPFSAKLATLFADNSLDPTNGNLGALMSPFFHDLANNNNNTDTNAIKNKLAQSGAQRRFFAATILSGGKARLYTCPFRWDDDLVATNQNLNGRFFAFEGELIQNVAHTVELVADLFHLLTNTVVVPNVATIVGTLAADPNVELMGPYANGDANTEGVKTRKLCPVPHFVGGIWLSRPDGITPREFWTMVYPEIVNAGKQGECAALIQFFQVAITLGPNNLSVLEAARPTPPARDTELIERQLSILHHHFPQLRPEAAQQQAGLIAQEIGVLAQQQKEQYDEAKREKELSKRTTLAKFFGPTMFAQLLRMLRLPNEAAVNAACPVYLKIAEASKSSKQRGELEIAVRAELLKRKNPYLKVLISQGVFTTFLSLMWERLDENSLTTGFLANLFLWGGTDEQQQRALNVRADMTQSGQTAVNDADAQEILKVKVNLPMENQSVDNLERLDVLCHVVLPMGHPFRTFVKEHLEHMKNFRSQWEHHETSEAKFKPAKGLLHCQWLSLRFDQYWSQQSMVDDNVALPDPSELFNEITLKRRWEPILSASLTSALKFDAFCRTGGQGSVLESGADGGSTVTIPGLGQIPGMSFPDAASTDVSSLPVAHQ